MMAPRPDEIASADGRSARHRRTVSPDDLWGDYWADARLHGCTDQFPSDVSHQLAAGWHQRFATLDHGASLLDVACGRGAVLAALRAAGGLSRGVTAIGVDLAPAPALAGEGFVIRGGIDATALPFADRSFAIVTSQFGIEYAGLAPGLDEAARVAASQIILFTHAAEGIVAQHAAEQAGQAQVLLGSGQLAAQLRLAMGRVAIFDTILTDIAGLAAGATNRGLLEQLYGGVGELRRLAPMIPAGEMAAAIDFMVTQLGAHAARMQALARAAPTRAQIDDAAAQLRAGGFDAVPSEQRSPRGDLVGYWLDASRREQS